MDNRKSLIQTIKTYKGMLQRQNKIIKKMSNHVDCTTIDDIECKNHIMSCSQCIREYFEKESK